MIHVVIKGHDIYESMRMPAVPRKGDILWLQSLSLGRSDVVEVIVSKVEWARDHTAWVNDRENEGIHAWLTVRRHQPKEEP
jgi:hypothetical protein